MKNRMVVVLSLSLLLSGPAFAEAPPADAEKALSVITWQFKHKSADKAAAMIKTLMSAEGSVSMQSGNDSLVITDRPENMKAISAALANYDAPAQAVQLSVRLASARSEGTARVPDNLRDVAPNLAMLRFNAFENLGSANIEGKEGDTGLIELGSSYRADFRFGEYDPAIDSIPITDFRLSRLDKDQLSQLYKTTMNLKVGRTVIFLATRDPKSQRALVVILTAKR